jgi:hypothetical protein
VRHKGSRTLALLVTAFAAFCPAKVIAADASDYSILYTGRLFGYFRYPNVQKLEDHSCPEGVASVSAQKFLEEAPSGDPRELRVAMGDNFAPEVFAAKLYDSGKFSSRSSYFPYPAGAGQVDWRALRGGFPTLRGNLPSDAVGCFLQRAGFNAIVPGKDDFYFGPERVSDLARFLHDSHDGLPTVQMLAANLIVSTTEHNPGKPLPNDELAKPVLKLLKPNDALKIDLPKDVLPWLREVPVDVAPTLANDEIDGELCTTTDRDPNTCLASISQSLRRGFSNQDKGTKRIFLLEINHSEDEAGANFILIPDRNYAFCAWPKYDKKQEHCQTFTVRQPLFQVCSLKTGDSCDATVGPIGLGAKIRIDEHSAEPYYVSTEGPPVAVFGVVDPAMMKQVGLLNYSWANENPKYDTAVKVIDPAEALDQALAMCAHDERCRGKQKVLLAQMPLNRARSVIAKLQSEKKSNPFDVILTQVDSQDYTGSATLTTQVPARGVPQTPKQTLPHEVAPRRPLFLVPADHSEPSEQIHQSITTQRAIVTFKQNPGPKELVTVTLKNEVAEYPLVPQASGNEAKKKLSEFDRKVRDKFGISATSPATKTPYEYLAMEGMRRYCHADLAIMQPRDVYEQFGESVKLWPVPGEGISADAMFSDENLLEEALWKGDTVICRTITGADLKKSLALSSANEQPSLQLLALGVEKDVNHDSYIVAGDVLDDKRPYSAAMTDFLAFGDTNYPDLGASDVPPPDTIRTLKKQVLVADVASPNLPNVAEVTAIAADQIYDRAAAMPPAAGPVYNAAREIGDWWKHWIYSYDLTPTLLPLAQIRKHSIEKLKVDTEHRAYSYLNLEKLNLSYQLVTINGPQQQVPNKFGGITNVPQLQSLESQTVAGWGRVRFGRVFSEGVDFFNVAEARYGFGRTRLTADAAGYDPYQVSIAENAVTYETGFVTKRLSEHNPIRFLLSERLTTQLRAPLLSYSTPVLSPASPLAGKNAVAPRAPSPGASSNCKVTSIDIESPVTATSVANILCSSPRSELQETKVGIRLENRDSWIETGWETGHNFNSTTGYIFNKNTSYQVDCPAASQSLASCIANNPVTNGSPLYVTHQTLPVSGIFLNFKIGAPVYQDKIRFSLENYTEVFRVHSQDTSADTRFYQDVVASLPVKIWQNLAIAPQVEMFYFQNKVLPQHFLSLTSQLTLQYSFPWHSGMSWRRALTLPYPSGGAKSSTFPVP